MPDTTGERLVIEAATPDFSPEAEGYAVADWVLRHGQPAGRHTDTLTGVDGYYLPLQTSGQVFGILAIIFPQDYKGLLTGEQRRFLASFSNQVAVALGKSHLSE